MLRKSSAWNAQATILKNVDFSYSPSKDTKLSKL